MKKTIRSFLYLIIFLLGMSLIYSCSKSEPENKDKQDQDEIKDDTEVDKGMQYFSDPESLLEE